MARDVRVDITSDASGFRRGVTEAKADLEQLNAAGAAAGSGMTGLDRSADGVGKTFQKTGKLFKGTGKLFKSTGLDALSAGSSFASTVPQLGAVSSALGTVAIAGEGVAGLLTSLSPVGLAVVGAAAVGAGAAFLVLRDDASYTTDALNAQRRANEALAASHRATVAAITAQRQAQDALSGAILDGEQAALDLEAAEKRLKEVGKSNSKGSLEYRQALLDVKQAEAAVGGTKKDLIRGAQDLIKSTKESSDQLGREAKQARENAAAAKGRAAAMRLGFIAGKDGADASKEIEKALKAETGAARNAAVRHRESAASLQAMAAKMDTSTAEGKELKESLLELSRTQVNLAAQQQNIAAIGSSASFALGQVNALAESLRRLATTKPPSGGTQESQERRPGYKSSEINLGGPGGRAGSGFRAVMGGSRLSASDVASAAISTIHRDDSLQDKQARARGEASARSSGVTNPERLAAEGDAAVLRVRRQELDSDAAAVTKASVAVQTAIGTGNTRLGKLYAQLRTATGKQNRGRREKLREAIAEQRAAIRDLYDELRALVDQGADIQADADEIDYDIGQLASQIAQMSPTDSGTSTSASSDPNLQAQLDQVNAQRTAALGSAAVSASLIGAIFGASTIEGAGPTAPVFINVEGSLVRSGELPGFITAALDGQSAIRPSVYAVGA